MKNVFRNEEELRAAAEETEKKRLKKFEESVLVVTEKRIRCENLLGEEQETLR